MSADESLRLAALRDYRLLDRPVDDELRGIVRMAARVLDVPFAAVNLIDENLQCQLTTVGFAGSDSPRSESMCALHFRSGEIAWTSDASQHPDYHANPWVDGSRGKVRFYASAPLVTADGHALGSLCVFDEQARQLDDDELALLRDAASIVMALLDRRRQAHTFAALAERAERQSVLLAETLADTELRTAFAEALLETVDVGIVACDASGHLSLFNRAARDWHGIDAEPDLVPEQHAARYSLFHADGVTALAAHEVPLAQALHQGSVTDLEFVIAPQDRPAVVLVASGRALTTADGQVRGAVVVMRDVTEERAQAAALAESEAKFRSLFESAPIGMVVNADNGSFLQVNPAFARLAGRTAADLVGLGWHDVLHPDDMIEDQPDDEVRLADTQSGAGFEKRLLRPDGSVVWAAVRTSALPAADTLLTLSQARDVTDRKHAEQRAARETDRLRTTIAVQRELTAAATDRDHLLALVAERASTTFSGCRDVIVGLVDDGVLRASAVTPGLSHLVGVEIGATTASLSGEAVSSGRTLRTGNAMIDPRADHAICASAGIASMMAAPLFAGDEVIGAVTVISGSVDVFDENDEQQLTLLADALSGALRHADDAARKTALLARTTEALKALETSEARFRLGFDRSPLGMMLIGLRGSAKAVVLQVNPAMAAITGYPAEQLTGMNIRDLHHPDEAAQLLTALDALAAGQEGQLTFDKQYRHADGRYIWVRLHAAVVRDDNGSPVHLIAQVEDIDAERASAAQLSERAQLLDLTQDAVIVRSLDGRIHYWNPAAEHVYGWPAHIAAGHDLDRLLDTTWPDGTTRAQVDAVLLEQGRWAGELEHRRADGQRVVLLSRKALQRDADGNPIGVLSINTDVTARRHAELALAASEQRFRSQFAHSTVGQMIRGLDDTIEDVNPAFAAMLGYHPDQLIGSPAARLFDPSHTDDRKRALASMYTGDTDAISAESHLIRADGTPLAVHLNISVVRDSDGQPQRFVGIFQDITDRKTAEKDRDAAMTALAAQNIQLQDANQLKLDLIGMLGHEINNPLTTILGIADHGLNNWDTMAAAEHHKLFKVIDRNAQRLNGTVREVLALVSLDAGKLTAHPEPTAVLPHLTAAMAANHETTEIHCPADLVALVQPGHLDQIITNLLSNAAKYGGGAKAIHVLRHNSKINISVEDHGPGVPEAFRSQLFERFSRSDNTAGHIAGTGLGLYIVRELARANRGDINYRPRDEGGSIFTLHLLDPE